MVEGGGGEGLDVGATAMVTRSVTVEGLDFDSTAEVLGATVFVDSTVKVEGGGAVVDADASFSCPRSAALVLAASALADVEGATVVVVRALELGVVCTVVPFCRLTRSRLRMSSFPSPSAGGSFARWGLPRRRGASICCTKASRC